MKHRFISLAFESQILSKLPAMSKGEKMINDMRQTKVIMNEYRKYILNRIDYDHMVYHPEAIDVIFNSEALSVHLLSSNIWPSFWVSTMRYAGLALSSSLLEIQREYYLFFYSKENERIRHQ